MSQQRHEELARRYLLGTLSEEERARLEEQYFSDDATFDEIEIAEEELIDKYVRSELSKSDNDRFEATLGSSPRLIERVEFARIWKDKLAAMPLDQEVVTPIAKEREDRREQISLWQKLFGPSTPRLAFAFSLLIVVLGGLALLAGWLRVREQSRQLAAQQAVLEQRQRELDKQAAELKSKQEELATQSAPQPAPSESPQPKQVQAPSPPPSVFALTLSPGAVRSTGGGQSFRIPSSASTVEITLQLRDGDYSSYRAAILDPDRRQSFQTGNLKPRRTRAGNVLVFRVPIKNLPPGSYSIAVDGIAAEGLSQTVDDYPFRIMK